MVVGRMTQRQPSRPLGVVLLALLQIWNGVWYLLLMLVFFAVSSSADETGDRQKSGLAFLLALLFLILGVYALWLARGYIKGFEWARRRGISVAVFAILLVLVEIVILKLQAFLPESPFWTIVGNFIIIWYLGRENVRRYFASRSSARK